MVCPISSLLIRRALLGAVALPLLSASSCNWSRAVDPSDVDYAPVSAAERYSEARRAVALGDDAAALEILKTLIREPRIHLEGHRLYQDLARKAGGSDESEMRAFYARMSDDGRDAAVPYLQSRLKGPGGRSDLLAIAISRDDGLHYAYVDLAEVWREQGNFEKALEASIRAYESAPDDPGVNLALARNLGSVGRGREAAERYRKYLSESPGDLAVFDEYLRLLVYSLGDTETAKTVLERLEEARPNDPELLLHRAALLWREGDLPAARALYREALGSDPSNARAALNLANAYFLSDRRSEEEKRADWPKAQLAYTYFLQLDPGGSTEDVLDALLTVPARLAVIADLIGPLQRDRPIDLNEL